jgi:hypothetical protein
VAIRRTVVGDQPRQKVHPTAIDYNKPGLVVYVYNLSYVGGIGKRIMV